MRHSTRRHEAYADRVPPGLFSRSFSFLKWKLGHAVVFALSSKCESK